MKTIQTALMTFCISTLSPSISAKPAFSPESIKKAGINKPALAFRLQPYLSLPIRVTHSQWTDKDEERFGLFVKRISDAVTQGQCNTVQTCFKNKEANPYAATDPQSLTFYADCGIFPYLLRAYFAYKNGLPFSIAKTSEKIQKPQTSSPTPALNEMLDSSEPEAAPYGNFVTERDIPYHLSPSGVERNFQTFLGDLVDSISTRLYRIGPMAPNHDLTDLYPVPLNRAGIRAGTVIYTTGHVYIISSVDENGTIHVLDAHPDNSLSSKKTIDASKLERSRPDQGLGFYRFRQSSIVNARELDGALTGGEESRPSDLELFEKGLLSYEQFFGPDSRITPNTKVNPEDWKKSFARVDYFSFLESRLRNSGFKTDAAADVSSMFTGFCTELQQRMTDVDVAVNADNHIHQIDHPAEIPANIFSTSEMTWETFSSPSRDGRLRAGALNILKVAVQKYRATKEKYSSVYFHGKAKEYQQALLKNLNLVNQQCKLGYVNSQGKTVTLSMQQVLARLYSISFDPYHCPERRWGASGGELNSCKDGDKDGKWYRAEQVMRNTIGKTAEGELLVIRSQQLITLEMLMDSKNIDQPSTSGINLGTSRRLNLNLFHVIGSEAFVRELER